MGIDSLTKSQKAAYQKFIEFMLNPNQSSLIIQGSAGTGKSYLTKYLIEEGISNYRSTSRALGIKDIYNGYAACATTNKAVEALERQINTSANNPVTTLSKLLGLYVDYNPKTHQHTLVPKAGNHIISNKIIFIDECSMISADVFEYINVLCRKCKIIYIGDKFQLPPVKEKISKIYQCNYPEVTLTDPVRNAGNKALMALCEQLKNTCETGEWHDIHSCPGSIEVIKEGSKMQKIFNELFTKPKEDQKVIAYTNKFVTSYAQCIMDLRGEKDYLAKGAWYTSNNFYKYQFSADRQSLPVDAPIQILDIKDVSPISYRTYKLTDPQLINSGMLKKVLVFCPFVGCTWWDTVFADPNQYLQYIKWITKQDKEFARVVQEETLDLRRSESCTIHKAQGSTLDTVIIDLYDISTCTQKDITAKLLYVAASRAKNKVIFYGELSKRYGVTVA